MSKKSIVVGLVIFVFLLITGVLIRKNNEDIVRISTKKVMTVYSNENQTITLFTDFNHMEKGSFTNPVKINLNKFNEIEYKKIRVDITERESGSRVVQLVNDRIKNNEIYVLNNFGDEKIKATISENENDLKSVWDFNSKYQSSLIHNKTDKNLYLEPITYSKSFSTTRKKETIKIAPNQIVSGLATYLFENKPAQSINFPKGINEVTLYWLHY